VKPEDLVRPEILALEAYPVPNAEGMVKLDAMEIHTPCRSLCGASSRSIVAVDLNRYPDPSGHKLRELLARKMNVPAGWSCCSGNGFGRAHPDDHACPGAARNVDDVSEPDLRHVRHELRVSAA